MSSKTYINIQLKPYFFIVKNLFISSWKKSNETAHIEVLETALNPLACGLLTNGLPQITLYTQVLVAIVQANMRSFMSLQHENYE